MSADNWARCPRCLGQALAAFDNLERQVNGSYGKVPVEEFDRLRAGLEAERAKVDNDENFRTLGEYWDIGIDEEGTFEVDYCAGCNVCKFQYKYEDSTPIPGLAGR